jgi:signal transduction histidine kinase
MLFMPIKNDLATSAHRLSLQWQQFPENNCSPPSFGPRHAPRPNVSFFFTCFDQHGNLLQRNSLEQPPAAFLTNALARQALQAGYADDTVSSNSSLGNIYRYAVLVADPSGKGTLGVVQVGISVAAQDAAMQALLAALLLLGTGTLSVTTLGGLFLAHRALAPTRLAFERQQHFIADASHELRTPLTLLRADAEVLLRGSDHLPAEDVALLQDIVAETTHMSTLASNMLTLARLDASPQHLEQDLVNLDIVANDVARRAGAFATQMGVTLELHTGESTLVLGDTLLLEQAALILLDNAIKYNRREGHVTIRTYTQQEQAHLEVQDTGIGIAAKYLQHMGERFYRVDKARSRESGGTGLGLSIAYSIANAHKGTVTITSTEGKGTTARLILPLAYRCGMGKHGT